MTLQQKKGGFADDSNARMRLIQSAIDIFAEKGYAATPVREIVDRAGVTKPVLYYYFGNKKGLFEAALKWAEELQVDMLQRLLENPGSTLERLIGFYKGIYQEVMKNRNLFKMIHSQIFGPRGTPDLGIDQFHLRMVDAIKKIYDEGLLTKEVISKDPDDVAILILSLIETSIHLDNLHPESSDPERSPRLIRIVFQGLAQNTVKE